MTDWTGTIPTLGSLHVPTVAELAALTGALDGITDAQGSYAAALSSSGTQPTGQTITGSYARANKMVRGRTLVTFAAGVGTGNYFVSAPVTTTEAVGESAGSALFFDASAGTRYPMAVFWIANNSVSFGIPTTGGRLTNVAPVTVAAGDQISVKWDYEGA